MKGLIAKGFTLIEITIVIIIISIISVSAVELLRTMAFAQVHIQNINEAQWDGEIALERLTSDLHSIQSPTAITTATATALTFKNIQGSTISYQLSGNLLLRNSHTLANKITSFTFVYYDSAGNVTTTIANIRYIAVNFTITSFTTYDFTTGVFLWAAA